MQMGSHSLTKSFLQYRSAAVLMRGIALCALFCTALLLAAPGYGADVRLTLINNGQLVTDGRLLLFFSKNSEQEPRFYSYWPTADSDQVFAMDVNRWGAGEKRRVNDELIGFPEAKLAALEPGTWYVQALIDHNRFAADINAEGNIYSDVSTFEIPVKGKVELIVNLNSVVEAPTAPKDNPLVEYVNFKSDALSDFWQRDVFLNAAVLLPSSYQTRINDNYPVVFHIGGFRGRYTRVEQLFEDKEFKSYWYSPEAPQAIVVFLDGEAPFGDSYQINSDSNGPYGDATWLELLPYLQQTFRMAHDGKGFFTTGCSTGGWVSLALQIYYPELFNGVWSFSADAVDFRALQLINIYEDSNAFYSEHGSERPSARELDGEVLFTIKDEVTMERTLGLGNNFVNSAGQWGAWMSVFGPRGSDGLPVALWDENGVINHEAANTWRAKDLRLYVESNWRNLGPLLAGKLNLYMGERDDYYLNNAMALFDDMLSSRTNPESDAQVNWQARAGHCDMSQAKALQMVLGAAVERWQSSQP